MPRIRADNLADHNDLMWSLLMDAFEHLLALRPYESITIADLASEAGVARNTIYNYAVDKPTLLAAAAERAGASMAERIQAISAAGDDDYERIVSKIVIELLDSLSVGLYRNLLLQAGFASAAAPETLRTRAGGPIALIEETVSRVLSAGVSSGVFREVYDLGLAVQLAEAVIESAARRIVREPGERDRVVSQATDFLLHAFGARCQRSDR